jgi:uncharacterized membrane protein
VNQNTHLVAMDMRPTSVMSAVLVSFLLHISVLVVETALLVLDVKDDDPKRNVTVVVVSVPLLLLFSSDSTNAVSLNSPNKQEET